jgi:tungstate transport system substrate-binding protein
MTKPYRLLMAVLISLLLNACTTTVSDDTNPAVAATYGDGPNPLWLATGSPGELGLLGALAEGFAQQTPVTLKWVKVGSGASLQLLKDRQVDMVMVHAPAAEKQAVREGWATQPTLIGSNEFYIVGPSDDPAGVEAATSAADAYRRIAESQATFITRDDDSGTHKKELAIWNQAEIEPAGDWYVPSNDFMTASLKKASALDGYFMTDSSTWVAQKTAVPNLTVLFRGDPFLVNTYHALLSPPDATANRERAASFVDFVASPAGQAIIRDYGVSRYGEPLYQDAAYAEKYVDNTQ